MKFSLFRFSLNARIFLATSLLLIAALGSIVVTTFQVGHDVASKSVNESIANSLALQNYFRDLNNRELLIILDGFAGDPSFSAYVAEAAEVSEQGERDLASIEDLLAERKSEAELDFIILLDPEGKVIVHTEVPAMSGRDFSQKKMIAPVIQSLDESTGIWIEKEQMYQAAVMPLSVDYDLVGFIVTGLMIDKTTANEMKQIGGGDTLFLIAKNEQLVSVASTFDIASNNRVMQELTPFIQQLNSANKELKKIKIELGGNDWSVQPVPLASKENQQTPFLLIFSSETKYMQGYNKIFNVIFIAAILTIIISIGMSFFLTSGILIPIKKLAAAALSAASGDYNTQVKLSGNDELANLSNSIDHLLSDLRDKQDMQNYISELSKNLPEEKTTELSTSSSFSLPESVQKCCLLMVDINQKNTNSSETKEVITQLQKINDLIMAQITNAEGIPVRIGSNIFVAAFSQSDSAEIAYSVAGGIDKALLRIESNESVSGAKYALSFGCCNFGTIINNKVSQKIILGKPVDQGLRLLQEQNGNRILATRDIYQQLKLIFKSKGIAAKGYKGGVSGKTLCSLDLKAAHEYSFPLSPEQTQVRDDLTIDNAMIRQREELTVGSLFAQRYEILASLGKGSMGLVFKALDRELGERVALKILRQEIAEDADHLERLRSEIILARRVTHPNILRTYDFGKVDDIPFLSMEYVRGMTLRYLIENSGKLPYSAALRVSRQLCEGLESVHQLGILHRDIKAENVILEPNGNLKLMDFGIARTIKKSIIDKLDEGLFVGTPSYASPEQVRGEELGVASDIYSLGILMTEIFTGQLPIIGETAQEICVAHVRQKPISPSILWPEIPTELEKVILKCLQKEPSARYADVKQLHTELMELSA